VVCVDLAPITFLNNPSFLLESLQKHWTEVLVHMPYYIHLSTAADTRVSQAINNLFFISVNISSTHGNAVCWTQMWLHNNKIPVHVKSHTIFFGALFIYTVSFCDYMELVTDEWMNMNTKYWWIDMDSRKQKYAVKNLSQYHFDLIQHKSHMNWPWIEREPSAVRGRWLPEPWYSPM
jgi:hypothetical protein